MSTFLQSSFNARSAENTSSVISPGNSSQTPLGAPNGSFTGAWVPSAFYSVLQITAKADALIQILVEQSFLGVEADQVSDAFYNTQEDVNILRAAPFYAYITMPFMRILVSNIDTIGNTIFELATKLTSTPPPQNVHVIVDSGTVTITGPLPEGTNSIGYVRDTAFNTTAEAWQALQIDAGNLKVVEANSADIKTAVESLNTNVVLCDTDNVIIESGTISVDNFPATQPISGSVSIVGALPEGTNSLGSVHAWAYNLQLEQYTSLVIETDSNLKVVEKNSTDILTTTNSINTKITACDTDNVIISAALPYGTNSIGAVQNTAYNNAEGLWKSIILTNDNEVQVLDINSEDIAASLVSIDNNIISTLSPNNVGGNVVSSYIWAYNAATGVLNGLQADAALNLKVVEANSADISDAVDSIDAKITACDTGAVVISSGSVEVSNFPATQPVSGSVSITGALPEGSNTIGVVRTMAFNVSEEIWEPIRIDAGHLTVVDTNSAGILTAVDSIDAKITACDTGAVVISSGSVEISNFPATQPVSISSTVQVQDLPLENIAGHNAPRPVYNMVVGHWYRVANTGNTDGAVWIQIGAPLFNGATLPDIGVLFQCLYLYLNYSTTGTVWDEPYNTWEADNLLVVGQNLQVVEANSASINSKITACNTGAVVISSGTINTQSSGNASSQASVPTVPVTSGVKWNGPSTPMANYSMVQVAIKASATSITTTMTFMVEYSPNNTDWFPSDDVLAFTNGGPLNIMTAGANFTAMPYVRVSYDPPAMSTDTASDVIVYFLKKS